MATRREWEIRLDDEVIGWVVATWPEAGQAGLGKRLVLIRANHGHVALDAHLDLPKGTMDDARDKARGIVTAVLGTGAELRQVVG